MSSPYPAAEEVVNAPGGSTDWAEMSPGQRVTFLNWSAERGFAPCDGAADVYSPVPPAMCPVTETARILTNPVPRPENVVPGLGSRSWMPSVDFMIGLAAILIGLAVVGYMVGDKARQAHPILAR